MYSLEVDTVSNTEWSALLRQFDDATIYQTWSCGAVLWGADRLSHVVLRNGDEAVGIAQVATIQVPIFRGDTALLVLAASNAEGRSVMASYLLQWNIIGWLKMKGVRSYDLGGISPIHPEVNYFKAGIGGENVSHAGSFEQCANPLSSLFDRSLGILKYGRKRLPRKIS